MTRLRPVALLLLAIPAIAAAQPDARCVAPLDRGVDRSLPIDGRLHALVLFIDYADDTLRPKHDFWRVGEEPQWLPSFIDATPEQSSGEKLNITSYFRAMSLGRLALTGESFYVQAPKPLDRYVRSVRNDGTAEPEDQAESVPGYTVRDVLRELAPRVDMSRFDRWTIRPDPSGGMIVEEGPDGAIDLAIVGFRIWYGRRMGYGFRAMGWAGGNDTFDLADGRRLTVSNICYGLNVAFYFPGIFDTFVHEIGHRYSLPHQYAAGIWSIMSGVEAVGYLMNGPERERVGWGRMIDVDRDTVVTIPDLASTGAACRIRYPIAGEVFVLENHQFLPTPGITRALDGSVHGYDVVDRTPGGAPGLYVVRSWGGSLEPRPADGTWKWSAPEWVTASWSATQQIPVFERAELWRDSGLSDRDWIPYENDPLDGSNGYQPVFAWRDPSTGRVSRGDRPLLWGDGNDRYTVDGANVLSAWSSPSSQTIRRTSDTTYAIEHCTVEIIEQRGSDIVVRVRFTDRLAGPPSRPLGVRATWSDAGAPMPHVTWPASIEPDVLGDSSRPAPGHYQIERRLEDRIGRTVQQWAVVGRVAGDATAFIDTAFAQMPPSPAYHLAPIPSYRIRAIDAQGLESNPSAPFALARGAYRLDSADATRSIWILPNPIVGSGSILYSIAEDGDAEISVHDAAGRLVLEHRGHHVRGDYRVPFAPESEGAFVATVRTGARVVRERIAVVR